MKQCKIFLYGFDELSPSAQSRAISEHRFFLLDTLRPDFIDGVTDWNDPEKMEMYEAEYNYIECNDDPVIESIEINEYLFFNDGTLAPTITGVSEAVRGESYLSKWGEYYKIEEVNENV